MRFLDHVRSTRLFPKAGEAIVAVSGGPDSVALLDLLHTASQDLGLSLVVAHVDHGISPDSRTVAQSVSNLARQYGLPFETVELDLGSSATETAAREARYRWLRYLQQRRGATYLVTAHHQDDQVETILLRVLRGSAPSGLAGIAARARGGLVGALPPVTRAGCGRGCGRPSCRGSASDSARACETISSHSVAMQRATRAPGIKSSISCRISGSTCGKTASPLPVPSWAAMITHRPSRSCVRRPAGLDWCSGRRGRVRSSSWRGGRPDGGCPSVTAGRPKSHSISFAWSTPSSAAPSSASCRAASAGRRCSAISKSPGRRRRCRHGSSARRGRPGSMAALGKCGRRSGEIRWCRSVVWDTGRCGVY